MSKEELCALLLLIISLKLCSRSKGVKLSPKKIWVNQVTDVCWGGGGAALF